VHCLGTDGVHVRERLCGVLACAHILASVDLATQEVHTCRVCNSCCMNPHTCFVGRILANVWIVPVERSGGAMVGTPHSSNAMQGALQLLWWQRPPWSLFANVKSSFKHTIESYVRGARYCGVVMSGKGTCPQSVSRESHRTRNKQKQTSVARQHNW
jgi:hypothetical protein